MTIDILRSGGAVRGDYSVLASVDGAKVERSVVWADETEVRVDCDGERIVTMSWAELLAAAHQADEVATVYRRILELAEHRHAHYARAAAHAKLLSDALTGRVWIYVSAEQDSTNVWWVSAIRAGTDGVATAQPLFLRDHPVTIYAADEGGTLPTRHLAALECADIAARIRKIYPHARVQVQS